MPFCCQGICGGLEDNETIEESARREVFEEAGMIVSLENPFMTGSIREYSFCGGT